MQQLRAVLIIILLIYFMPLYLHNCFNCVNIAFCMSASIQFIER
jgi:hypothetical protein